MFDHPLVRRMVLFTAGLWLVSTSLWVLCTGPLIADLWAHSEPVVIDGAALVRGQRPTQRWVRLEGVQLQRGTARRVKTRTAASKSHQRSRKWETLAVDPASGAALVRVRSERPLGPDAVLEGLWTEPRNQLPLLEVKKVGARFLAVLYAFTLPVAWIPALLAGWPTTVMLRHRDGSEAA